MKLHQTRLIERPRQEVFEYTADFTNIGEWDPGVDSSRKLTDGPVGVGTEYEVMVRFGARRMPMVYEITEYQPNDRVVLVGRGETLEATDEIRFESRGERQTLVDYTADLEFQNFIRYVAPLMSPILKRVGERAVNGLVDVMSER